MRKLLWPFRSRDLLIHAGSHFVWKENATGHSGISAKRIHVGGHGVRSSLHLKWQGRKASHMSALSFENTDVILDGGWDIPEAREVTFGKGTILHMRSHEGEVISAPNARIKLEDVTLNLGALPMMAGGEIVVLKGRNIQIKGEVLVQSDNENLSLHWHHCPVQGLLIRAAANPQAIAA